LFAIADSGSFTQAAKQVHRTQSAVSLQMQRLEAAAGRAAVQEERPPDGDDRCR
jgi:DNA-binding transcriptional LysR family regulator